MHAVSLRLSDTRSDDNTLRVSGCSCCLMEEYNKDVVARDRQEAGTITTMMLDQILLYFIFHQILVQCHYIAIDFVQINI